MVLPRLKISLPTKFSLFKLERFTSTCQSTKAPCHILRLRPLTSLVTFRISSPVGDTSGLIFYSPSLKFSLCRQPFTFLSNSVSSKVWPQKLLIMPRNTADTFVISGTIPRLFFTKALIPATPSGKFSSFFNTLSVTLPKPSVISLITMSITLMSVPLLT